MAEASPSPAPAEPAPNVNLQVLSPSPSVNRPLSFSSIPASTTVRQLKDKIRDAVDSRPQHDRQRLIHRGRLLARDEETLEHILGAEAIRSGEQQTLHLVLRELSDHHHPGPGQAAPLRGQSPVPGLLPQQPPDAQQRNPNPQQPRPHTHAHIHAHPHHHVLAGQTYPPGNRPLTAPMMQIPPGMFPAPFQPQGPFPHPTGAGGPNHEQIVNQAHQMIAQMMNQNQQRAGTPVGAPRVSPIPPLNGQDPAHVVPLGAQLALQLALNAQQQENLANQAEQLTAQLANQGTNQPSRPAPSQQSVNQGNLLLHHGNQLMGEAQQFIDRSQRERAAAGLHGIQDHGHAGVPAQTRSMSGRNSPAIGQPVNVTREVVGPNGQYIRMTTTVGGQVVTGQSGQAAPAVPGRGSLLPNELQALLRGTEASQATQAMTDAMHRSASGASLANMANLNAPFQPIAPGVTTSIFQNPSRHGSRTATPDPWLRMTHHGGSSTASTSAQTTAPRQTGQGQPEVYILSSPTGPRALLMTNHDAYFSVPPIRQQLPPVHAIQPRRSGFSPSEHHHAAHDQRGRPQNQVRMRVQAQQPRADAHRAANANGEANPPINLHQHPRPPNAGAGVALAALWPHLWLLVRLGAFVWWFTASDSSWSRWITVVLIAIGVFAVNTGLLNGIANQAWDPFRRHLEGLLLPVADPNNPNAPQPGGGAQQGAGAAAGPNRQNPAAGTAPAPPAGHPTQQPRHENPDPAEAAARLVAQRRNNNANWVMDQIRRAERAGLLFLASIAPGVAERHIAHLEAQERAAAQERARREAAEAETQAPVAADDASPQAAGQEQEQGPDPVQGEAREPPVDGQRQEGPLIPA